MASRGRWRSPKVFSLFPYYTNKMTGSRHWQSFDVVHGRWGRLRVYPSDPVVGCLSGSFLVFEKFHSCFHMVVYSFWWNFKFSNDCERPLTTIWKLAFTFQAENLHLPWLGSSSFPDWNARTVLSLICTDTLIHNCPAKRMVHQWIPHWTFWSVWKFPSQPDQKIHISFQFSSPFSMCTKCFKGVP